VKKCETEGCEFDAECFVLFVTAYYAPDIERSVLCTKHAMSIVEGARNEVDMEPQLTIKSMGEFIDDAKFQLWELMDGMDDMDDATEPLKLAVNLAQKIGLPDYSSAEMSMHVSGITADTSDAEVEATIERGRLVYTKMGARLAELAKEARQKGGW
jgi:hypothetical protein